MWQDELKGRDLGGEHSGAAESPWLLCAGLGM